MGASSINIKKGLTEMGYEVSIVKKAMMESSDKVVSMFTSDKLDTKMPHVVCEIKRLDIIVTELDKTDLRLKESAEVGVAIL